MRDRSYRYKNQWRTTTRQRVFARHGAACVNCGNPGSDGKGKGLVLAHVIPHELGGRDDESNLVPLCNPCSGHVDGGRRYAV